jgi:hypothetical protein
MGHAKGRDIASCKALRAILIGYTWLVVATLSTRTQGLLPINAEGGIGGLTLSNWDFVFEGAIWNAMLNSLLIAVAMVIGVGIASTSGGYALSRFTFPDRKGFLTGTPVLHAFKAEMLLIALGNASPIRRRIRCSVARSASVTQSRTPLDRISRSSSSRYDNASWPASTASSSAKRRQSSPSITRVRPPDGGDYFTSGLGSMKSSRMTLVSS